MNSKLVFFIILIATVSAGCSGSGKSASSSEVAELERNAMTFARPYIANLGNIAKRVSSDFSYRKVLLSESPQPFLTLVDASGNGKAFYVIGDDQLKGEDGKTLPAEQLTQALDLVKFLRAENLSGFVFHGNREAIELYIKPNLALHYLGGEIDSAVIADYARKTKEKYDYRGDFCLRLSDVVYLCSERR